MKAQRHVTRRTRGSHRRAKAVRWLRRRSQRVQCQRRDFHHKIALDLLRAYDTISLEDVRVAQLVRNPHLAQSISDAAWRQFGTILAGQAAYAGRRVCAVPAHATSQDGGGCGERVPNRLSVRTPVCRRCGLVRDRDENAASNVLWAGQALRGRAGVPLRGGTEKPLPFRDGERVTGEITPGFILMGGPVEEEGGAMLIVRAENADEVRGKLKPDPWYAHGVLQLQSIHRWDIFIDERA